MTATSPATSSPATSSRPAYTDIGEALGTDYFLLKKHLTEDEQAYLERTRRFVEDEVNHPGFDAHLILCDRCASRSAPERSP